MCEKPLTPTAAEAEELFKIAKTNKRILGVYQNRRWDGDFLTIQKLIKDNTVSPPSADRHMDIRSRESLADLFFLSRIFDTISPNPSLFSFDLSSDTSPSNTSSDRSSTLHLVSTGTSRPRRLLISGKSGPESTTTHYTILDPI